MAITTFSQILEFDEIWGQEIPYISLWPSLQTDHKALLALFSPQRGIPPQASAHIQRWALTMAMYMYEYTIAYRSTATHGNARAAYRKCG